MPNITGTTGDDTLTGTSATDTIMGLGGNDILTDILGGFDTLQGGDGNDTITVVRGNGIGGAVAMEGGEGDDRLIFSGPSEDGTSYVNGGNGNDYIDVRGGVVHAGAGNDTIVYRNSGAYYLEAGSDTIYFPGTQLTSGTAGVEDFTPGAGGDRIDFGTVLAGLWGWDQSSNPFGTYLRLREVPANNLIVWEFRLDSGAATYQTFMASNLFDTSLLTAFNLGGYTLNGAAPAAENLTGTGGDDTLAGGVGSGTINALGGNDTISGGAGADVIDGGDGNDAIDAGLGNDTVQGGLGNDTITDNFGFQGTIDGGAGNDLITVDLSTTTQPSGQPLAPAQFARTINGGNDDDTILVIGPGNGNSTDFTVNGGSGTDRIEVSSGRGTINAGDGNDLIIADIRSGFGALVTLGAGVDTVRVGAMLPGVGDNSTSPIVITDFQAGAGGDVFDIPSFFIMRKGLWNYMGNPINGSDARLVQNGADVEVQIHSTGSAFWTVAVLQNRTIAQLHADNFGGFAPDGSPPADQNIVGDGSANTLTGGHGNDTIQGLAGNDILFGGFGNDLLQGGDDNDVLDGQWADDTLEGGGGNDVLTDTLGGNDTLRGGDGNDVLTITRSGAPIGTLVLEGGDGNDVISAPTGTISGGAGNDTITTTKANYVISGGDGNDTITMYYVGTVDAGAGDDILRFSYPNGTTGDPQMPALVTLGAGKDAVVAANNEAQFTVTDFQAGEEGDRIDISVFGPNPFRPGGPLIISQVGADTVIGLRVGEVGPEFQIILQNVQATDLSAYNLSGVDSTVFNPAARTYNGTPGPDTYISADGNDTLNGLGDNDVLYGAGGNDTINGGSGHDTLYGGSGNDTIHGGEGNDVIEGGAGADDQLYGDAGNDVFFVSDSRTDVWESVTQGRDVIYAEVDYALNMGSDIEVLSTISYTGTAPLTLIGNELVNELYGNAGANYLDGGANADYMAGFGGNDVYIVDVPGDMVAEGVGEGNHDVVYARGDYVMTAGAEIEVLSAISQAATTPIYLVGNERVNEIYGTEGVNYLDGGAGVDYLGGFGGNDTYIVETLGDFIIELAGQGRDVVYARANYVLNAGASVEVVSTIQQSATTAINLTGNELSNEVYGNAGVNTLNGGAGADFLMGFGGTDTFAFTTALGGGNVDQILDFSVADDTIALDDAVFAGLATGALAAGAFVNGTAAADADDRILYNSATGQILFDADGNGGGAAVLFATVSAGTVLTASDFMVI